MNKSILIILTVFSFSFLKAQTSTKNFSFKTTGDLKCKLIYNQYYDSLVHNFELCSHDYQDSLHNHTKYFFKFKRKDNSLPKTYDIVYLVEDSCKLKYNVLEDSITYFYKHDYPLRSFYPNNYPILVTDRRKKLLHIETDIWTIFVSIQI